MTGKLKELTFNRDGTQNVTVTVAADFRESFDELKNKPVNIEIKRAYKKRSLDANAFAWVLINKIAAKFQEKEPKSGWTPLEVYRGAIRNIAGVCTEHCMPNDQVDQIVEDWLSLGSGFQVELFPSKIEGCTNGHFWKGSHIYNTQQMNVLIQNLIQIAEENGIPTISDKEAERMIQRWGGRKASCKTSGDASSQEGQTDSTCTTSTPEPDGRPATGSAAGAG